MLTLPLSLFVLVIAFLGVVIGLPGAIHINPILLHFFDPHTVTFLTTALLFMTSFCAVIIFWRQILWKEAVPLTFYGALGGILGGLLFGYLPAKFVVILFFISGLGFLWKHYRKEEISSVYSVVVSGFLTSFLQAFGISAGALRRAYLFSKGYSMQAVYATISVAYSVSALGILTARSIQEDLSLSLLYQLLLLFPAIFITILVGKKMMGMFSKKMQEFIVVYSLIVSLALAIPYLFA